MPVLERVAEHKKTRQEFAKKIAQSARSGGATKVEVTEEDGKYAVAMSRDDFRCHIEIDRNSTAFLASWNSKWRMSKEFEYAVGDEGCVNPYHRGKATTVTHNVGLLCRFIQRGFECIRDGKAEEVVT